MFFWVRRIPLLADFMSYMALRNMLLIGDNIQVAIARNRLISFDYAEAFCFSELFLNLFITFGSRPWPISVDPIEAFTRNLSIDLPNGYDHLLKERMQNRYAKRITLL